VLALTGDRVGELRRLILHVSYAESRVSDAKADRERSERSVVEVGKRRAERGVGATERAVGERGSHRRVREDGMRPEATGRRPRTWGGAAGGESSPSTGWRETAERMVATEGARHR